MLAQTNLQLYRLLIDAGWEADALKQVRVAYDVARQLFGDCFRPSHKPFIAHLIGTAAGLAGWGERPAMVVAGLLHSAYLYGQFADGENGASPARRRWFRQQLGSEAESLIADYTDARWSTPLPELLREIEVDPRRRELLIIKLADTMDDCADGAWKYSSQKKTAFGITSDGDGDPPVMRIAAACLNPSAVEQFRQVLLDGHALTLPDCLRTEDQSYHRVHVGIEALRRSALQRRLHRLYRRWREKRAA
jgi:hypothetical protein